MAELKAELGALFGQADMLLVPCVPGVAPEGLDWTGDPAFQGIWTALYVPTVTLPAHRSAEGLPVGIQLVGRPGGDGGLLGGAGWASAVLSAA